MNKRDNLYYVVLLMLVLNGFLVFKLFSMDCNKPMEMRKPPHQILVERLHFTPEQEMKLHEIYGSNEQELHVLERQMMQLKNELFNYSKSEAYSEARVGQLAIRIGDTMQAMDIKVFHLMHGIREICDAQQKKKFDAIFKDVFHIEGRKRHLQASQNLN
ncbi:Spy/CpxP family protein refolding chaperone [Flavobacterium sp.]|uniref:Spy/CpxP family protein refolding chaperone n=1 Tax=Flavobacterium sp. TaxID=239 RepID=UPI003D120CEF